MEMGSRRRPDRESPFRLLFSANPLPMWVYDVETLHFLEVNDAAVYVYGYSREQFLRMSIAEIRPPFEVTRLLRLIREYTNWSDGIHESGEWTHTRRDGQLMKVLVYSQPLTWEGRSARLAVARDVTAQARAEDRLRESEERLRLAMDSGKMGTWDYYPESGDLSWCRRCRDLVEVSMDEKLSFDHFLQSIHPDDRDRIQEEVARVLASGDESDYRVEYRVVGRHTGRERWVVAEGKVLLRGARSTPENVSGPLGLSSGGRKPWRFIGTVVDITDRKESDERLRRLTAELLASNRELEQFATVVSHDLREPLRMITAFLTLLSRKCQGKLDSEADEFIAFAVSGAGRLGELIEGLMQLSDIGRTPLNFREFETQAILNQVLRNLSLEIRRRQAQIRIAKLPSLWCESKLLELVFQNLIGNALEYSKPGRPPLIDVSVWDRDKDWEFAVSDEGVGLDPKSARRVFDPFVRVRPERMESGRGMGLTLSKKAIERHGGRLWVDSALGEGATFRFTLPKRRAA